MITQIATIADFCSATCLADLRNSMINVLLLWCGQSVNDTDSLIKVTAP
ncbi:hypothetical protein ACJ5NV_12000 [Loktanella agnita]